MADRTPWLSVVMPTYNGEAYLESALRSLGNPGPEDLELIVVDDGSTDGTIEILEKWASHLPLRLFKRPHCGNWLTGTNYGIDQAKGNYVCFLHQDDVWMHGRLDRLKEATERNPSIGLFLHPAWFINDSNERVGSWTCPLPRHESPLRPELVVSRLLIQNFIAMPSPLFKRKSLLKAGPMDEKLWFTADWKLWLTLAAQGPVLYLPEQLAGFRIHAASQTMTGSKKPAEIARQIRLMYEDVFPMAEALGIKTRRIRKVAELNVDLNVLLAARAHGQPTSFAKIIGRFILLGPVGWHMLVRDSRIFQRVIARWRAGLAKKA